MVRYLILLPGTRHLHPLCMSRNATLRTFTQHCQARVLNCRTAVGVDYPKADPTSEPDDVDCYNSYKRAGDREPHTSKQARIEEFMHTLRRLCLNGVGLPCMLSHDLQHLARIIGHFVTLQIRSRSQAVAQLKNGLGRFIIAKGRISQRKLLSMQG